MKNKDKGGEHGQRMECVNMHKDPKTKGKKGGKKCY